MRMPSRSTKARIPVPDCSSLIGVKTVLISIIVRIAMTVIASPGFMYFIMSYTCSGECNAWLLADL